ncbi:MAG: hypothetical protein LBG98_01255 [Puniceicoccales bacterium]|nr:hypothetical protein [Puniceicoccales bacterium]
MKAPALHFSLSAKAAGRIPTSSAENSHSHHSLFNIVLISSHFFHCLCNMKIPIFMLWPAQRAIPSESKDNGPDYKINTRL